MRPGISRRFAVVIEATHNEPFGKCLKNCLSTCFFVLFLVFTAIAFALILWVEPADHALAWGVVVALGGTAVLGTLWSCLLICGIERFVRSLLP